MAKPIPAVLVLHGPTTLKVMHCADLASAKAAVIPLVRERGGEHALKALSVYNEGCMYEWRDQHGRGYAVYLSETPLGERAIFANFTARCPLLRRASWTSLANGTKAFTWIVPMRFPVLKVENRI
jgi:hypothetical protein